MGREASRGIAADRRGSKGFEVVRSGSKGYRGASKGIEGLRRTSKGSRRISEGRRVFPLHHPPFKAQRPDAKNPFIVVETPCDRKGEH